MGKYLTILQILFSIIVVALAGYGLFTADFRFQVYMILFLGLTMLVMGLKEFNRNKKVSGWMLISVFAFSMFVVFQSFINY